MAFNPTNKVTVSTTGAAVIKREVKPAHITIAETMVAQPLKTVEYYCDSVQIQSVRSDMSNNNDRIGIGNSTEGWGNVLDPGGDILSIDSPSNGVLDLSRIYIYGTVGDEVSLLIMES
jgi:hypothetical protein